MNMIYMYNRYDISISGDYIVVGWYIELVLNGMGID
jgi:hypothetical protein